MKKTLLFLLVLFLGTTYSYASHVKGAAITYTCVGGNTYEVTLKVYRDCAGITLGTNPQTVDFQSTSCSQSFSQQLPFVSSSEMALLCPTAGTTTCNGGTLPGTEEYIFRDTVQLTSCFDWVMSWDLCCRNAATTNLVNPANNSIYVQTTLNSVAAPCNSSPQYVTVPVALLCVGELAILNVGALDSDGDSLHFQVANSFDAPGVPIPFSPGYSLNNPIMSSTGINLNSQTGELCFTPSIAEVSAISILVSEYRNGVLVGSQIRDLQIAISGFCSNTSPISTIAATCGNYSGMNVTVQGSSVNVVDDNSIIMCKDDTICFDVPFSDIDTNNLITVTSNIATTFPGATFTIANNNTTNPVATFCWVPTSADVGLNVLSVFAEDNACPIKGTQNFMYDIEVLDANCNTTAPCNNNASFTYLDNGNGNFSFTNTSTGSYTSSNWSFGDGNSSQSNSPSHTFITDGVHVVVLAIIDSSSLCVDYSNVAINVTGAINPPACNAAFSIYPDTSSNTIIVVNSSAGNNLTYSWNFGDGNTSTAQYPNYTYATAGPFQLCLRVDDGNGCIDTYCDSINSTGLVLKNSGFNINVIAPPVISGLDHEFSRTSINVYPNPTSNQLNIVNNGIALNQINIIDITGKKLTTITSNLNRVNVAALSPGIYFIELVTEKETIIQKFVKQ